MTASEVLRQVRGVSSITQRELSAKAKIPQSRIAEVESGAHETSFSKIEELLEVLSYTLIPVPTTQMPVWKSAKTVSELIYKNDHKQAWRHIIQLSDTLTKTEPAIAVALTVTPPASTGDERYDALLAGTVSYCLGIRKLPKPLWVTNKSRSLKIFWDVEENALLIKEARKNTPREFRDFGIYIHKRELQSI